MSLHLSKCHIVGNHMSRLIFLLKRTLKHVDDSIYLVSNVESMSTSLSFKIASQEEQESDSVIM